MAKAKLSYARVQSWLFTSGLWAKLSPRAAKVLMVLIDRRRAGASEPFDCADSLLLERTGLTPPTLRQAKRDLVKSRIVRLRGGGGRDVSRYQWLKKGLRIVQFAPAKQPPKRKKPDRAPATDVDVDQDTARDLLAKLVEVGFSRKRARSLSAVCSPGQLIAALASLHPGVRNVPAYVEVLLARGITEQPPGDHRAAGPRRDPEFAALVELVRQGEISKAVHRKTGQAFPVTAGPEDGCSCVFLDTDRGTFPVSTMEQARRFHFQRSKAAPAHVTSRHVT